MDSQLTVVDYFNHSAILGEVPLLRLRSTSRASEVVSAENMLSQPCRISISAPDAILKSITTSVHFVEVSLT